jgi:serine/threonine-protein kinase ATR
LSQLQNPGITSSVHKLDVLLHFDSIDPLALLYGKERPQNTALDSTYAVQDAAAALWHVTNLLSMLVDICIESATSHHAAPAFQDYLAWLLDSFVVAHGLQKRWHANHIFSETSRRSEAMGLSAVLALLSTLRESLPETIFRKGCVLLSFLCLDLLESPLNLSDKSTTHNICSSLLTLATACKRYESTCRSLALYLAPAIRAALDDNEAILHLGKDFQVSTDNILCNEFSDTVSESRDSFMSGL